jgi:hypothetical protein
VDVQTGALWRIASTRLQRTGEIVVEPAVNRLAWSSRLSHQHGADGKLHVHTRSDRNDALAIGHAAEPLVIA